MCAASTIVLPNITAKPFAAEKTPDYVRHTQLLAGLFPQSRFVHLWRDGRDVALSLLEWATPTKGPRPLALWKSQPLATAALWWQEFVLRGRHEGPAAFGDRYLELSYEALLQDPNGQVERVTTHLGLPFDPCMLEFHRGKTHVLPDRSAKQNWLPPIQGLRDWRQTMSHTDVQLFEAIAGDTLELLGYPRVNDRCEPQIADVARTGPNVVAAPSTVGPRDHRHRRHGRRMSDGTECRVMATRHVNLDPHDRSLVQRESQLRGLGTLLDPDAFQAYLAVQFPD